MKSGLIDTESSRLQAINDCEYAELHQDEWRMSKRTRYWLVTSVIVISAIVLYLFCFVLPSLFVPKSHPLDSIVQVKKLGVQLYPVLADIANKWREPRPNSQPEYDDDVANENSDIGASNPSASSSIEELQKYTKKERLVVVGDIHGQQKELHRLLRKIKFNKKSDELLVLGDFISKGPRSLEVIDDLIEMDAKCILGNHEYYVLQNYAMFHGLSGPKFAFDESAGALENKEFPITLGFNADPEYILAKKLQPRHIRYINLCPVMLEMGPVPLHSAKNNGRFGSAQGIAVHAGLRWDLTQDLNKQRPLECLEMRSYISPYFNETSDDASAENAVSWSKIWNAKHKEGTLKDDFVVYYGHDARRGLNLKRWAKGLDSGCTKGESLTAMVIWQEKTPKGKTMYKEETVSVSC